MDIISNNSYWYIGMMEQVECEQEIFMSLIESKYYEVNGVIQEGFSFKEAKQKIINAFKKMIQFFKNVFINIKYALKKKRLGITNRLDERIKLAKKIIKDNPNFQQTAFVDYNKELKDSDADKLIEITNIAGKVIEETYNKYKPNRPDDVAANFVSLYNSLNESIDDFISDVDTEKRKQIVDSIKKTVADTGEITDEDYEGTIDIVIKKIKFIREDLPLYMDDIVYSIVAEKSGIGTLSNIGNIIHNKKEQELKDKKSGNDIEVKAMPMSSKADNLGKNTCMIKSVYDIDTLGSQCKRLLANNTSYEIALEKMKNNQEKILKSMDNTRDAVVDAVGDTNEYIRLLDITYSAMNATYTFLNSVIESVLKIYSYLLKKSLNDLNAFIGANNKDNEAYKQYIWAV